MGQHIDEAVRLAKVQEVVDREIKERLSTANVLGWGNVDRTPFVHDEAFLRVLNALIKHGRAPDLENVVIEAGELHGVSAGRITVGCGAPSENIIAHILK